MPANWPTFINNVSNKLASRTLKGPIEMGKFVAREYFKAVATSQTLFGNIHVPGQFLVLQGNDPGVERLVPIATYPPPIGNPDPNDRPDYPTELINPGFGSGPVLGFTKAFSELHSELKQESPAVHEPVSEPTVEEKFTIEEYSDFEEGFPVIKPFNPTCELEEWIEKNKSDLGTFKFYEYFKKNKFIEEIVSGANGSIDTTASNNLIKLAENILVSTIPVDSDTQSNIVERKITFKGTEGGAPYTFKYSIDGVVQPDLKSDDIDGVAYLNLPEYAEGNPITSNYELISVIGKNGIEGKVNQVITVVMDPDFIDKDSLKNGFAVNQDGEAQSIGFFTNELNLQEENTQGDELSNELVVEKDPNEICKIPDMLQEQIIAETAKRIWYEFDGTNAYYDFIESLNYHTGSIDSMCKSVKNILDIMLYDNYEHNIKAELDEKYKDTFKVLYTADGNRIGTSEQYKANKEFNDNLEKFILSETTRIYDERKANLIERVKSENNLNRHIFQETHEMNNESIPEWLDEKYLLAFTYINILDKGFSWLGDTQESVRQSNIENTLYSRLDLKKNIYEDEIAQFADLKKKWIESVIEEEKAKAAAEEANESSYMDPYVIMAEATINYWKSTTSQPFSMSPPIPLCNVPIPGTYIPIYYGSKTRLANDLRKAWNSGKSFSKPGQIRAATTQVATAVAAAHARHLAQLKFIYVGQLTVGVVTIPMIGFSPTAF